MLGLAGQHHRSVKIKGAKARIIEESVHTKNKY
jgi:hypothetical protein